MPKPVNSPDPEVVASPANDRRQRRRFSPEEKLRIVEEANSATERGAVAALLRREGIYASQLADWRRQLKQNGVSGLQDAKPGRKGKDEREQLIEKQQQEIERLRKEVRIQQGLIDLQVKAHEILGIALPRVDDNEMADLQDSSNSATRRSR
jgi:transposase-like protein